MDFGRENVKVIVGDLNRIFENYGRVNNLKLELGNIVYSADDFKVSLKCFNTSNGDYKKIQFEKDCFRIGVPASWYKKAISYGGQDFEVIAVRPRAKKYPILLRNLRTGEETRCLSYSYAKSLIKD